ncbi:MAG TPA: DNA polymerase III subunit alpha, partial [Actinomycetota bacterium]|nr:DNA polymerase III subunit alpha [Actinomycetota bacterium]
MAGFSHLHCHTTWSLRDGAIPAEVLPHLAAGLGYEAVAMTDHDALTGAVRFAHAAKDAGVKAIFGAELTLETTEHVTLIARDKTGYANLCRLISDAHLSNERDHPRTTFDKVAERAEGLFVLSGCERGEIARLAAAGRLREAIAAAERWRRAIGNGYRIEVFDHRGYGHRTLRDRLLKIAHDTGIAAVATNDVHYAGPWDAGTHELLHAIREIVPLSATQAIRETSEYHFKDPKQMEALFADAPDALGESMRIVDACEFELGLGTYHFPDIPLPKGESAAGLLARRCYEGAYRRYDVVTRTIEDRLQHELTTIFNLGWPAYFLLVADIVDHTRKTLGIRCACRGSAAGSLVCYVLGISDVDPVGYDLLFERFMNTRREELPDIDVDVESHRREEVLAHILDTYGSDQVAMCCMVDTFRARMAIREVGKALGLPPEEIDLVAKAFPRVRAKDIPAAIERLPELSGSNLDAGQLTQLFELCMAIDGFPRHLALHPSGVILSAPDLADRVPMQESFQGFTMLQADKDDVEELGLAKLDVLGVRMLSAIAHASDEIERTEGVRHHLEAMPRDDSATFELIRSSKTLGCFQIESPGQRELLARFQPSRFEDLLIDISLFRPGPVKSDMVSPFLDRRHGFADTRYAHPCLEPILKETYGVVVYHEQVIRVIAAVTGCSLDDADYVRRHLDAERPAAPDDPNDRPKDWRLRDRALEAVGGPPEAASRGKSHPGMGRGFRELPEAIAYGAEFFSPERPETVASGSKNGSLGSTPKNGRGGLPSKRKIGEGWVKDQRVHSYGVAGPIEITPPKDDVGDWFVSSAIGNGFSESQARHLWKEVFAFASFGFCKSHAAAFALPTYISAWLKTHYPAHFLAGVLTHDPGMYPRRLIVADARQFGIPILPIDINASASTYRVERVSRAREA